MLYKLPSGELINLDAVVCVNFYDKSGYSPHCCYMRVEYRHGGHPTQILVPVQNREEFEEEAAKLHAAASAADDRKNGCEKINRVFALLDREGLVRDHGRCVESAVAGLIGEHARLRERLQKVVRMVDAADTAERITFAANQTLLSTNPRFPKEG